MTVGTKLECDHFPGETLEVNKIYNEKLFSVTHNNGKIMATRDLYDGPRLCLAHINRKKCKLRIKQEPTGGHKW